MESSTTISVLVVEDDGAVRRAIADGLGVHGFDTVAVPTAEEARTRLRDAPSTDVLVVDVGLPGMSGTELCAQLRREEVETPILILSARDAVGDRVVGLEAGADDYLVKPFDLSELVARLTALHRRATRSVAAGGDTIGAAGVDVDPDRRIATAAGERLDLTKREFDLLETLVRNRNVVMSRGQLLDDVWGYDFEVDTNVVDVFVGYLRKKLRAVGRDDVIRTVRGVGFVIEDA